MVITVLEARVAPEKTAVLQDVYQQAINQLDEGIVQTFLLRSAKDPEVWQIVTIWESHAALEAMRRTSEVPKGVLMFRAAEAQPALSVYEVVSSAAATK